MNKRITTENFTLPLVFQTISGDGVGIKIKVDVIARLANAKTFKQKFILEPSNFGTSQLASHLSDLDELKELVSTESASYTAEHLCNDPLVANQIADRINKPLSLVLQERGLEFTQIERLSPERVKPLPPPEKGKIPSSGSYPRKGLTLWHKVAAGLGILLVSVIIVITALPIKTIAYTSTEQYQDLETYVVQEPYTEQEPYIEQESYTVQEPYKSQEPYTIDEQYTTSEPGSSILFSSKNIAVSAGATKTEQVYIDISNKPENRIKGTVSALAGGEFIFRIYDQKNYNWVSPGRVTNYSFSFVPDHSGYYYFYISNDFSWFTNKLVSLDATWSWTQAVTKTRTVTNYRDVTLYADQTRTRDVTKYHEVIKTREIEKQRIVTKERTPTKYKRVTLIDALLHY